MQEARRTEIGSDLVGFPSRAAGEGGYLVVCVNQTRLPVNVVREYLKL